MASTRIDEQETVGMESMRRLRFELCFGERSRRGGFLQVVPVLDSLGGGGGNSIEECSGFLDDGEKSVGNGGATEQAGLGGELTTEGVEEEAEKGGEEEAGRANET